MMSDARFEIAETADGLAYAEIEVPPDSADPLAVLEECAIVAFGDVDVVLFYDDIGLATPGSGRALSWVRVPGYTRLTAAVVELSPPRERVTFASNDIDLTELTTLYNVAFSGRWGHKRASSDRIAASLVKHQHVIWRNRGAIAGFCRGSDVDGTLRLDGPAILPPFRAPEKYAAVVLGAVAELADPGTTQRVVLECWGDDDDVVDAYEAAGFVRDLAIPGWLAHRRPD